MHRRANRVGRLCHGLLDRWWRRIVWWDVLAFLFLNLDLHFRWSFLWWWAGSKILKLRQGLGQNLVRGYLDFLGAGGWGLSLGFLVRGSGFWKVVRAIHEGRDVSRGRRRYRHLRGMSILLLRGQGLLDDDLWLDYIWGFLLLKGWCTFDGTGGLLQIAKILIDFSLLENLIHDGPSGLHIGRVKWFGQTLNTCVMNRISC